MHTKVNFPHVSEILTFSEHWDLHAHTVFGDGRNSVKEMIDAAEVRGLNKFALTEHVRSEAIRWWPDYVGQIKKCREGKNVQVLIGMEANAIGKPGNVDVPEEMWQDAELVLGSVHGYYNDDTWEKIEDGSLLLEEALMYEVEKEIGLCNNPRIDVLSHPGFLFEKCYEEMPSNELRAIVRAARKTNTAIELNPMYLKNHSKFFEILLDENPLVSFGSNAHRVQDIGSSLLYVKRLIL